MAESKFEKYKFTKYFENEVLRKRPYIKKEWCIKIIENPIKVEKQEGNRWRFWGVVEGIGGLKNEIKLLSRN
jgi:hypothetical protein